MDFPSGLFFLILIALTGMCPNQESSRRPFGAWMTLSQLNHTGQGSIGLVRIVNGFLLQVCSHFTIYEHKIAELLKMYSFF